MTAFLKCGVDIIGIEGSYNAWPNLRCPKDRVIFADLRKPLNLSRHADAVRFTQRALDLALTIEVAEHIESRYANVFVSNLVRYQPRWVMMTAATPGQGGCYHVNERPQKYWIQQLALTGYQLDSETTAFWHKIVDDARTAPNPLPLVWEPENLLFFKPNR